MVARVENLCAEIALTGVLLIVTACNGGNGQSTTTPSNSPPAPSFQIACSPSPLEVPRGCGSGTCSVTSVAGFNGPVSLRCAGQDPGVFCSLPADPANVPSDGRATVGLTVSVDGSAAPGVHTIQITGEGGGVTAQGALMLNVQGSVAPEIRGKSMTITGCAGYEDDLPSLGELRHFGEVFVGAWRSGAGDDFCEQTLSSSDGSFSLVVPRCFPEGASVFLTAGGLDTCITVPYRAGTDARVDLLGRRESCP